MKKRTNEIKIRFTDSELNALQKNVAASGMNREEYCRSVLGGAVVQAAPPADFYQLITQVKRSGSCLNEVLKKANIFGFLDTPLLKSALEQNYETEKMLWDTFQRVR